MTIKDLIKELCKYPSSHIVQINSAEIGASIDISKVELDMNIEKYPYVDIIGVV